MPRLFRAAADALRLFDDPALRRQARDVTVFDADLHRLVERLLRVQKRHHAVGVAASQIGDDRNVFTLDGAQFSRGGKPMVFINAQVVSEDGEIIEEEGCLSFPDIFIDVIRPRQITITAFDKEHKPIEREATGLLARAFSHETDHLQGRLLIDRVAPDVRDTVLNRMRRLVGKPRR
jgi:peptide deformylase